MEKYFTNLEMLWMTVLAIIALICFGLSKLGELGNQLNEADGDNCPFISDEESSDKLVQVGDRMYKYIKAGA